MMARVHGNSAFIFCLLVCFKSERVIMVVKNSVDCSNSDSFFKIATEID